MIFDALYESAQRGELLLVDGGFCHWHLRRDGQLTIREIISTRRGAGHEMLGRLLCVNGATSIVAKCPADLPSNLWYERHGFSLERVEQSSRGRAVNVWRRPCSSTAPAQAPDSEQSHSRRGFSTVAVQIIERHIL
jgi:hypothetical protein